MKKYDIYIIELCKINIHFNSLFIIIHLIDVASEWEASNRYKM